MELGEIKNKWTWDARCRIKAICASGMVEIDRLKQGYCLTALGKELCDAPKNNKFFRRMRLLSHEEIEIFQKGLLTNPPVFSVLNILNESRKRGLGALSKYDIGSQLGFVGDVGFTHFEAEFVAQNGKSFNDVEGDADKWARTIISWLVQVGWVEKGGSKELYGKSLPLYTTTYEVDKVLQYAARSTVKYVPQEMLCSDHHPFAEIIQQRRVAILKILSQKSIMLISEMVETMRSFAIDTDEETLAFDIINLRQAGIQISKERSYYRLTDKINLDTPTQQISSVQKKVDGVEKQIEHYVTIYADSIPTRLVDNIIRYGYGGTSSARLFEMTVDKLFSFMGYESQCLGQGQGRVADIIAKYRDTQPPKSYALIIDTKAYDKYSFPAGDVRKMKEYISFHGNELYQDSIPRHAFAFISMAFTNPNDKLEEIAKDTAVSGTAIDVYSLLELSSKVSQQQISISGLYPNLTTNQQFLLP
jgi:arginine repressor